MVSRTPYGRTNASNRFNWGEITDAKPLSLCNSNAMSREYPVGTLFARQRDVSSLAGARLRGLYFLDIAMNDLGRVLPLLQCFLNLFRQHHRPVLSAGAAKRNGQVAFPFLECSAASGTPAGSPSAAKIHRSAEMTE